MSERAWTVGEALAWISEHLREKGDASPRVSSEWLLSAATGMSRIEVYTCHDRPLSDEERAALRQGVVRRVAGEPLQHITGEMPFRHIVLDVRPGVFIPRPETEVLVTVALDHLDSLDRPGPVVVDACTGSGAVACSIAWERAGATVWAVDLSDAAVELAAANSGRLALADRVTVLHGDLLDPLPEELRGRVDAVVSNPPYVPTDDISRLPADVRDHDPRLALDGGPDGLTVAVRLMEEARSWLAPGGLLAMELDESRVCDADLRMREWYEGVRIHTDLAGRDRVLSGTLAATPAPAPAEYREADRS